VRTLPEDDYDEKNLKKLNAASWMVECLALNPEYVFWGPGEDYMKSPTEDGGWDRGLEFASWKEFNWELNELNEVVHYYFNLNRESVQCSACTGSGYNAETNQISEDFYDFSEMGRRWCDKITQDECDALVEQGRLSKWVDGKLTKNVGLTVEEVNRANSRGGHNFEFFHDAINRWILIETRAKRLGVWGKCPKCKGEGHIFTKPAAQLQLVLWVLHPRKGCSRGLIINNLEKDDLPSIYAYLKKADDRNRERFAKVAACVEFQE